MQGYILYLQWLKIDQMSISSEICITPISRQTWGLSIYKFRQTSPTHPSLLSIHFAFVRAK